MAWDWEKLNRQHQQQSGGVPPQMDDLVNQLSEANQDFAAKLDSGVDIAVESFRPDPLSSDMTAGN